MRATGAQDRRRRPASFAVSPQFGPLDPQVRARGALPPANHRMKVPMRVSSLLALFLSSALLAGCVGLGEETGATGAVTTGTGSATAGVAGGSAAAAAPIG